MGESLSGAILVAGFIISVMDNNKYIEEISKFCSPYSILVLDYEGKLKRIHCPFEVTVIIAVGNLEAGDICFVEAVRLTLDLKDVFIIAGRAYFLYYFRIIS